MKTKVLVVDDEDACTPIVKALEALDCKVKWVDTGEKAVPLLVSFKPDILITEIELPGISGLSLLELVAHDKAVEDTRVLVVTSDLRGQTLTKAFETGAEDFLAKPFDIRELTARVQVILRRLPQATFREGLRHGRIDLEPASRRVLIEGREIHLTRLEFGMLLLFIQKAGRVLSRDYLLQYLWGSSEKGQTRTVDMHVANLRKKLGEPGEDIETVKGIGYAMRKAPGRA